MGLNFCWDFSNTDESCLVCRTLKRKTLNMRMKKTQTWGLRLFLVYLSLSQIYVNDDPLYWLLPYHFTPRKQPAPNQVYSASSTPWILLSNPLSFLQHKIPAPVRDLEAFFIYGLVSLIYLEVKVKQFSLLEMIFWLNFEAGLFTFHESKMIYYALLFL